MFGSASFTIEDYIERIIYKTSPFDVSFVRLAMFLDALWMFFFI